jgi:hypothetical protein
MSDITPPWIKNWNLFSTKAAKITTVFAQGLSIGAELLIPYGLSHMLFTYLDFSPEVTMGVSITTAVICGIALPFKLIKEHGLILKTHEQIFRLFKPQVTSGYFGERIAPVIGYCGTFVYFTLPVTDFIRKSLFEPMGITNLGGQIFLIAPLMAGIGLAAPAQFLERAYTTLANWVATGGQVTIPTPFCDSNCSFKLFRIFCCSDDNNERADALEIIGRLQEMEDNTFKLTSQFKRILAIQLGIAPSAKEDSSLLVTASNSEHSGEF